MAKKTGWKHLTESIITKMSVIDDLNYLRAKILCNLRSNHKQKTETKMRNIMKLKSIPVEKLQVFILPMLVLLNFAVKGLFLRGNTIAIDEPFSIFHAQLDVLTIIKELTTGNNPPLYEILLHFWVKLFGISEFSVRMPSLIFSSVTVFYIYKLCKSFFSSRIALIASLLFIFSNYQMFYAHEARVYAMIGMLSTVSMYYYLKLIEHSALNKFTMAKYAVASILLIYAHYFGFFILIVQALYLVSDKDLLAKHWKKAIAAASIIIVAYIPNIAVIASRFLDSSTNGTWVSPVSNLGNFHDLFYNFSNNNTVVYIMLMAIIWFSASLYFYKSNYNALIKSTIVYLIIPLFFFTGISIFENVPYMWKITAIQSYTVVFIFTCQALMLLFVRGKQSGNLSFQTKVIVCWFWIPLLIMFLISYKFLPHNIPMFLDRYLMIVSVAFYILLAVSLDYIEKNTKIPYLVHPIAIMLFFALSCNPYLSNYRNMRETIAKINELQKENTAVVICPDYFVLNYAYYMERDLFQNSGSGKELDEALAKKNIYGLADVKKIDLSSAKHVIYLDVAAKFSYPDNNIKETYDTCFVPKSNFEYEKLYKIYEYESK